MDRVLVAGEALIDFIPDRRGPLAAVEGFTRRPGGAPANVASGLARLGDPPWFWTRIGDGPFGDVVADALGQYGVPDRFVRRDPDAPTALAFVSYGSGGDPRFTFYRDGTADTRMEAGVVPDRVLDAVGWLYVGSVPFSAEPSRSALFDLLSRADDATVVFDPNARPELWTAYPFGETVSRIVEAADVVVAAPGDLRAAGFDGDPERLVRAVLDRGPHTALVTLGEDGAYGRSTGDAPWGAREAAHGGYVVDAVDPTGAGDAFVAGVLSALAGGERSLDAVLAFANAAAALSTTAEGAMASLPDGGAVRDLRG